MMQHVYRLTDSKRFSRRRIDVRFRAQRKWKDVLPRSNTTRFDPLRKSVTQLPLGMDVTTLPFDCTKCYYPQFKGEETMRRRELIALLGASVAWPFAALDSKRGGPITSVWYLHYRVKQLRLSRL